MARIYSDEDFPGSVVRRLRELGHDVLTAREAGNADRSVPDSEVLSFASDQGRAVLTMNRRDFIRLHHASSGHWGIIVCRTDKDLAALALRIDEAIRGEDSLGGRLIRVNRLG